MRPEMATFIFSPLTWQNYNESEVQTRQGHWTTALSSALGRAYCTTVKDLLPCADADAVAQVTANTTR